MGNIGRKAAFSVKTDAIGLPPGLSDDGRISIWKIAKNFPKLLDEGVIADTICVKCIVSG